MSQGAGFLDLPREIRDMIYELAADDELHTNNIDGMPRTELLVTSNFATPYNFGPAWRDIHDIAEGVRSICGSLTISSGHSTRHVTDITDDMDEYNYRCQCMNSTVTKLLGTCTQICEEVSESLFRHVIFSDSNGTFCWTPAPMAAAAFIRSVPSSTLHWLSSLSVSTHLQYLEHRLYEDRNEVFPMHALFAAAANLRLERFDLICDILGTEGRFVPRSTYCKSQLWDNATPLSIQSLSKLRDTSKTCISFMIQGAQSATRVGDQVNLPPPAQDVFVWRDLHTILEQLATHIMPGSWSRTVRKVVSLLVRPSWTHRSVITTTKLDLNFVQLAIYSGSEEAIWLPPEYRIFSAAPCHVIQEALRSIPWRRILDAAQKPVDEAEGVRVSINAPLPLRSVPISTR